MPLEQKSSSAKVTALQKLLGNEEQKNVVAEIRAQPNFLYHVSCVSLIQVLQGGATLLIFPEKYALPSSLMLHTRGLRRKP